ncbi:hypothetical protein IAU59_007549 [Kwoniella sp. CBS 9459]
MRTASSAGLGLGNRHSLPQPTEIDHCGPLGLDEGDCTIDNIMSPGTKRAYRRYHHIGTEEQGSHSIDQINNGHEDVCHDPNDNSGLLDDYLFISFSEPPVPALKDPSISMSTDRVQVASGTVGDDSAEETYISTIDISTVLCELGMNQDPFLVDPEECRGNRGSEESEAYCGEDVTYVEGFADENAAVTGDPQYDSAYDDDHRSDSLFNVEADLKSNSEEGDRYKFHTGSHSTPTFGSTRPFSVSSDQLNIVLATRDVRMHPHDDSPSCLTVSTFRSLQRTGSVRGTREKQSPRDTQSPLSPKFPVLTRLEHKPVILPDSRYAAALEASPVYRVCRSEPDLLARCRPLPPAESRVSFDGIEWDEILDSGSTNEVWLSLAREKKGWRDLWSRTRAKIGDNQRIRRPLFFNLFRRKHCATSPQRRQRDPADMSFSAPPPWRPH